MYEYIIGKITIIKPKYIVLECANIGYLITVGNPYNFKLDTEAKIYVYNYVREDMNILYGFLEESQKELFLTLLGVNGIGPKSALSIIAASTVNDIKTAIETSNVKYLMKFPGIGQKASQQIILDLKGKIDFNEEKVNSSLIDVEDALSALGYNKKEISKAINGLDKNISQNDMIKQALKILSKV